MRDKSLPTECVCTLRESLVGDGCSICNPRYWAELEAEWAQEEAEDEGDA